MLVNSIKKGYKPYVLFLTQIQDINKFRIAKDIDANYFLEDAKRIFELINNCMNETYKIVTETKDEVDFDKFSIVFALNGGFNSIISNNIQPNDHISIFLS